MSWSRGEYLLPMCGGWKWSESASSLYSWENNIMFSLVGYLCTWLVWACWIYAYRMGLEEEYQWIIVVNLGTSVSFSLTLSSGWAFTLVSGYNCTHGSSVIVSADYFWFVAAFNIYKSYQRKPMWCLYKGL